jgi:hypothetical protein
MTERNIGSRTGGLAQFAGGMTLAAAAAILVFGLGCGRAVAAAPLQLAYRVTHSLYGEIGTYINTVEPTGNGTTVLTRAHFEVSMLGLKLYREDAERTERWQGNRLVAFQGVTSRGSQSTVVKGEARGDSFVISSPQGTITAPATVHPANPWSSNFLASNAMMRPDTGRVERVRVSGGEETVVSIDGVPVRAEKYEVDGNTRYTVWLDRQGVPVLFDVDDDSGKVTFTLAHCSGCSLAGSQLGMK